MKKIIGIFLFLGLLGSGAFADVMLSANFGGIYETVVFDDLSVLEVKGLDYGLNCLIVNDNDFAMRFNLAVPVTNAGAGVIVTAGFGKAIYQNEKFFSVLTSCVGFNYFEKVGTEYEEVISGYTYRFRDTNHFPSFKVGVDFTNVCMLNKLSGFIFNLGAYYDIGAFVQDVHRLNSYGVASDPSASDSAYFFHAFSISPSFGFCMKFGS